MYIYIYIYIYMYDIKCIDQWFFQWFLSKIWWELVGGILIINHMKALQFDWLSWNATTKRVVDVDSFCSPKRNSWNSCLDGSIGVLQSRTHTYGFDDTVWNGIIGIIWHELIWDNHLWSWSHTNNHQRFFCSLNLTVESQWDFWARGICQVKGKEEGQRR